MIESAIFAAGCFWGVEAAFAAIPGVRSTEAGYSGGHIDSPSYEDVCRGETGHAEAVRLKYDTDVVDFDELLDVFWRIHDPCSFNRQGPDIGSQYRSIIFYSTHEQRSKAIAARDSLQGSGRCGDARVATEIRRATPFYRAEEYHQRYYERHGGLCADPVRVNSSRRRQNRDDSGCSAKAITDERP